MPFGENIVTDLPLCAGGADMYLQANELKIGMRATVEQLSHILNKYMILAYDNAGDTEGTLVFVGNRQNKEYDRWFMQNKPITPIYHTH